MDDQQLKIYLAHHAVIKEDKDTTKVRVVFDASAKGSNGLSLNDTMMIGPTIQPDLRSLITCWRTHKYCFVSDIIKMYRQVKMVDNHTDLQCIIWRDSQLDDIKSYKLLRVTFGTAAAPFLAVRTLQQLAEDEGKDYPMAAEAIRTCFHVDDLLAGHEDLSQAKIICDDIIKILKLGGFELQKWTSNSDELLKHLYDGGNTRMETPQNIDIKLDEIVRILGLRWNRIIDAFNITINLPTMDNTITKRIILSDIARLFDPFGWLAPVIITAKIFIQKLWLINCGWDEELSSELTREWINYRKSLQDLNEVVIPRWIQTTSRCKEIQLHGFSDASTAAYAAVVYARVIDESDNVHVTIIASKSRVAPLKQLSIPRLELCGAVLLAKLMSGLGDLLKIPMNKMFAYTDSMVVLSWLQSPPNRWQVFVGNRVSEIIQKLDNDRWTHVVSADNPADLASRGIKAERLASNLLWWAGPSWLKTINEECRVCSIPQTKLEIKHALHTSVDENTIWERFSTLNRMKRVLAYCRRLTIADKSKNGFITTQEMEEVMDRCVKHYQELVYGEEIYDLKKHGKVKKRSQLVTFAPFLDKNNVLRVGGRLMKSSLSDTAKHQIIIPNKTHLAKLIIREAHSRTLHGDITQMMAYIRTRYWIIRLKSPVREEVRRCNVCIRDKAKVAQQLMGQLPTARVTPKRAFYNTGVDFCGPIQLRTSKGRGHKSTKGYISVFVCMCTRAIHLEAVTDLSAQGFIAAFRRFISRRGRCVNMYSDNATNFVGADRELKEMFKKGMSNVSQEISEVLANEGTNWHFIPPKAPNFGGLWEAGVRSVKKHLTRVNGTIKLTYEEMSTLLSQIEACLNSRPLCQADDTTDNLIPLTPGHFLIGEPLISIPEPNYENHNITLLSRWQFIQNRVQDFWRRWKSEYLNTMQQRYKWQDTIPSPIVGDIVIIKENELPPAKWLMGRIIQLHPGPDNLVRVVSVQTKGNHTFKRPLSNLIPLTKASE